MYMSTILTNIERYLAKYKWIFIAFLFFPYVYKMSLPIFDSSFYIFLLKIKYFIEDWLNIYIIFTLLIIAILYIVKKRRISKLFLIVLLIQICLLASTIMNESANLNNAVYYSLRSLGISGLIDLYYDDIENLLKGLIINYELLIYLNFVTIILFRDTKGYEGCHYLLGYYNSMMVYAYPAIAVATLYMQRLKKYVRPLILILISSLTILLGRGSTALGALIGTIVCAAFYSLLKKTKIDEKWIIVFLIAAVVLFNIFILFVYSGGRFTLIDVFIEKILHRETSFTGRTIIWEAAIELISQKPILGHGCFTSVVCSNGFVASQAHNNYLNILVVSGIVGFVLFMLFIYETIKELIKAKSSLSKVVMFSLLFGIFLSYITDAYAVNDYMFYVIFFLSYRLKDIIK